MSTYKRRIVYLSDEEWAELRTESANRKQTISNLVRDWIRSGHMPAQHFNPMVAKGELPWKSPAVGVSQKQRDDLLRKINRGPRPPSRPPPPTAGREST